MFQKSVNRAVFVSLLAAALIDTVVTKNSDRSKYIYGNWMKPQGIRMKEFQEHLIKNPATGEAIKDLWCDPSHIFIDDSWFNLEDPNANEMVLEVECAGAIRWIYIAGIPFHTAVIYDHNPVKQSYY
ncbi:uncharacterized protein LOC142335168 isoform X2 [Convolutriloba macropyga]|uniref:uncharacterized protein LOC142335168 isoform X2 n=1 Tax=Convolutriloba macropyga TaxID=536237 RepID=UPI003F5259D2